MSTIDGTEIDWQEAWRKASDELNRYRDTLVAINADAWANLAHLHIGDGGTVGTLACALATALQMAEQALEQRP